MWVCVREHIARVSGRACERAGVQGEREGVRACERASVGVRACGRGGEVRRTGEGLWWGDFGPMSRALIARDPHWSLDTVRRGRGVGERADG